MNFYLGDMLRHISLRLVRVMTEILKYHCKKKDGLRRLHVRGARAEIA